MKQQKTDTVTQRLYYKPEDEFFSKFAEISFAYKTTFKETLADGSTKIVTGGGNGPETHYKMIYLIKNSEYEKKLKDLPRFLSGYA